MIAARQVAFGGGKRKPYDAEIEYLGSDGKSSYIDFLQQGVPVDLIKKTTDDSLEISVKGNLIAKYSWAKLFLLLSDVSMELQISVFPEVLSWVGSTRESSLISGTHDYRVYYANRGGISLLSVDNNVIVESSSIHTPNYIRSFSLFSRSSGTEQTDVGNLIYGVQIKKNSVLILDLIPVRVGDVGYMYDRVSGKLFGNAGTGAFVLGSDI